MATLRTVTRAEVAPKATTTVTTEVKISNKLRTQMLSELKAYAELKAQADALDEAMNKHKANIRKFREATGQETLDLDGYKATNVGGFTTYFDEKAFVKDGGDLALYNKHRKQKPKKAYEKITLPGAKEVGFD